MPRLPKFETTDISSRVTKSDIIQKQNPVFNELMETAEQGLNIAANIVKKQNEAEAIKYTNDSFTNVVGGFRNDVEKLKAEYPDGKGYAAAVEQSRQKWISTLQEGAPSELAYKKALSRIGGYLERGTLQAGAFELEQIHASTAQSHEDSVQAFATQAMKATSQQDVEEIINTMRTKQSDDYGILADKATVDKIYDKDVNQIARAYFEGSMLNAEKAKDFTAVKAAFFGDNNVTRSLNSDQLARYRKRIFRAEKNIAEKQSLINMLEAGDMSVRLDGASSSAVSDPNVKKEILNLYNSLEDDKSRTPDSMKRARITAGQEKLLTKYNEAHLKSQVATLPINEVNANKEEIISDVVGNFTDDYGPSKSKLMREQLSSNFDTVIQKERARMLSDTGDYFYKNDPTIKALADKSGNSLADMGEYIKTMQAKAKQLKIPSSSITYHTPHDMNDMKNVTVAMANGDMEAAREHYSRLATRYSQYPHILSAVAANGKLPKGLDVLSFAVRDENSFEELFNGIAAYRGKQGDLVAKAKSNSGLQSPSIVDSRFESDIGNEPILQYFKSQNGGDPDALSNYHQVRNFMIEHAKYRHWILKESTDEAIKNTRSIVSKSFGLYEDGRTYAILPPWIKRDAFDKFNKITTGSAARLAKVDLVGKFGLNPDEYNNDDLWDNARWIGNGMGGVDLYKMNENGKITPVRRPVGKGKQRVTITFEDMGSPEYTTLINEGIDSYHKTKNSKLEGILSPLKEQAVVP